MNCFLKMLVFLSIFSTISFANGGMFVEIPYGHWSYRATEKLAKEGIINDYRYGIFSPGKTITRYEMALYIAELLTDMNRTRPETIISDRYRNEVDLVEALIDEYRLPLEELGLNVFDIKEYLLALKTKKAPEKKESLEVYTDNDKPKDNANPVSHRAEETDAKTRDRFENRRKEQWIDPRLEKQKKQYDRSNIGNPNRDFQFTGNIDASIKSVSTSDNDLFNRDNVPSIAGFTRNLALDLNIIEITPDTNRPWFGKFQLLFQDEEDERALTDYDILIGRDQIQAQFSDGLLPSFNEFTLNGIKVKGTLLTAQEESNTYRFIFGEIPESTNMLRRKESLYSGDIFLELSPKLAANLNYLNISNYNLIKNNDVISLAARYLPRMDLKLSGEYATSSTKGDEIEHFSDNSALKLSAEYQKGKGVLRTDYYNVDENFITLGNAELRPLFQIDNPLFKHELRTAYTYKFFDNLISTLTFKDRLLRNDSTRLERDEFSLSFIYFDASQTRFTFYYLNQYDRGFENFIDKDSLMQIGIFRHAFKYKKNRFDWGGLVQKIDALKNIGGNKDNTQVQSWDIKWNHHISTNSSFDLMYRSTITQISLLYADLRLDKDEYDLWFKHHFNDKNSMAIGAGLISQRGRDHLAKMSYLPYRKINSGLDYNYQFDPKTAFLIEFRDYNYRDDEKTISGDDGYTGELLKISFIKKF